MDNQMAAQGLLRWVLKSKKRNREVRELKQQLAASEAARKDLERDKEGLDLLEQHFEEFYWDGSFPHPCEDIRKAIDDYCKPAMEAQGTK